MKFAENLRNISMVNISLGTHAPRMNLTVKYTLCRELTTKSIDIN